MIKLILPEAPPALNAEEMDKMTDAELETELERRSDLHDQINKRNLAFLTAWHQVYVYREKRMSKAAIRAEVLAEMKGESKHE